MVPGVAPSLAHQTRQAFSPIALHPTCQRPERLLLLARNLGQRDVVMEEGAEDLETRDSLRTFLVAQCTQRCRHDRGIRYIVSREHGAASTRGGKKRVLFLPGFPLGILALPWA